MVSHAHPLVLPLTISNLYVVESSQGPNDGLVDCRMVG